MKHRFMTIAAIALAAAFTFASCEKPDNGDNGNGGNEGPEVPTGPDAVAAENLVAYFPLESETNAVAKGEGITFAEKKGTPSFVEGRRGNAYQGNATETYLKFNVAATNPFKTMKEYSISMWIKTTAVSGGAAAILNLNGGDAGMGNLLVMEEGGSSAEAGLDMKSYLWNKTTEWQGQDIRHQDAGYSYDKWFHFVTMYDAETSTMSLWSNGVKITDGIKYAAGIPEGGTVDDQPLLGELTFGDDMDALYIGGWKATIEDASADTWRLFYPGLVDEIRVYNKALSETEVKALYDAEIEVMN